MLRQGQTLDLARSPFGLDLITGRESVAAHGVRETVFGSQAEGRRGRGVFAANFVQLFLRKDVKLASGRTPLAAVARTRRFV